MISIHVGVPGSGKSYGATCAMFDFLRSGGVVASNIVFSSDWVDKVSFDPLSRFFKSRLPDIEKKQDLWRRNFLISNPSEIEDLSSILPDISRVKVVDKFQPLGLLVIDECQLIFNSRDWSKNFDFLRFFTLHRKMRWDIILIAHDLGMIDKQIRFLTEIEVHYRNLKNVKIPGISLPLSPVNSFLALHQYSNMATKGKIKSRIYRLNKNVADIYDSMQVSDFSRSISYQGEFPVEPESNNSVYRYRLSLRRNWESLHSVRVHSGDPIIYDILT